MVTGVCIRHTPSRELQMLRFLKNVVNVGHVLEQILEKYIASYLASLFS
jgi:hypothetical protein